MTVAISDFHLRVSDKGKKTEGRAPCDSIFVIFWSRFPLDKFPAIKFSHIFPHWGEDPKKTCGPKIHLKPKPICHTFKRCFSVDFGNLPLYIDVFDPFCTKCSICSKTAPAHSKRKRLVISAEVEVHPIPQPI